MRDALNATGRPIYYSITGILPYNDAQPGMHCITPNPKGGGFSGAFTVRPWAAEGREPGDVANSYLVEYCNNAVRALTCSAVLFFCLGRLASLINGCRVTDRPLAFSVRTGHLRKHRQGAWFSEPAGQSAAAHI